jgi:hypothetical protein
MLSKLLCPRFCRFMNWWVVQAEGVASTWNIALHTSCKGANRSNQVSVFANSVRNQIPAKSRPERLVGR